MLFMAAGEGYVAHDITERGSPNAQMYQKLLNIPDYESRYRAVGSDRRFLDRRPVHPRQPKRLEDP